jgi:hypothetical protein
VGFRDVMSVVAGYDRINHVGGRSTAQFAEVCTKAADAGGKRS